MYVYTVKDAKTGEIVASGNAWELVNTGRYKNRNSVACCYKRFEQRKRAGLAVKYEWERTGTPEHGPAMRVTRGPYRKERADRKIASAARQNEIAEAVRQKKNPKKGITYERLGNFGELPEHKAKFAQPPVRPKGDKVSALRWDVYELECLNWERRQQGLRALNYGEWRAGIR